MNISANITANMPYYYWLFDLKPTPLFKVYVNAMDLPPCHAWPYVHYIFVVENRKCTSGHEILFLESDFYAKSTNYNSIGNLSSSAKSDKYTQNPVRQ